MQMAYRGVGDASTAADMVEKPSIPGQLSRITLVTWSINYVSKPIKVLLRRSG
jgi:hypothetical protein